MNDLIAALRYPWQSKSWLGRLLPLALLQLIPLVGQLILIGYGLDIVRTISEKQDDLPRLVLQRAFVDGLRLSSVGLIYCLPVFLTVLLALSSGGTPPTASAGGVPGVVFPLLMIGYGSMSSLIVRQYPSRKTAVSRINRLVSALFIVLIILRLRGLFPLLRHSLQGGSFQLSGSATPLLVVALILLLVILSALLVVGTQFALTGSGLLNPRGTLQKLSKPPTATLRFLAAVWLVSILTFVMGMIGAIFLIFPGLLIVVAGSVSIWFLASQFTLNMEGEVGVD